jgi:hypothetical protein
MSAKLNLKIIQGSTFRQVLRWESSTKVYVPITNITKAAPVVITAVGHNIAPGWRARVTNVAGMKEINCGDDEYYLVSDVDTDTITINSLNSLGYTAYTSSGVVEYNSPISLAGKTARMQIRPKLTSTTILEELTTEDGDIILNNTDHTITILLPATKTDDFTFKTAVYSLEIIEGTEVTQLLTGNITLEKEVTRPNP